MEQIIGTALVLHNTAPTGETAAVVRLDKAAGPAAWPAASKSKEKRENTEWEYLGEFNNILTELVEEVQVSLKMYIHVPQKVYQETLQRVGLRIRKQDLQ